MARTSKANASKKEKPAKDFTAIAHITGEVTKVYEGKTAAYLTIKTNTANEYYDTIKVVDGETNNDYNEGDTIDALCEVRAFFDKAKKVNEVSFYVKSEKDIAVNASLDEIPF